MVPMKHVGWVWISWSSLAWALTIPNNNVLCVSVFLAILDYTASHDAPQQVHVQVDSRFAIEQTFQLLDVHMVPMKGFGWFSIICSSHLSLNNPIPCVWRVNIGHETRLHSIMWLTLASIFKVQYIYRLIILASGCTYGAYETFWMSMNQLVLSCLSLNHPEQ